MQGLILFIYRFRAFLIFILLEIFSGWLIVKNNSYQSTAFFHTSNRYAANILLVSNQLNEYLNLRKENNLLAQENAQLRKLYLLAQQKAEAPKDYKIDSTFHARKYIFIPAKVINSSTRNVRNYLTIDKGLSDGIEPGMGVITNNGIVGRIKTCSDHFSTVVSLLHVDILVSAQIKKNKVVGSVKWDGSNARQISLREVPKDINVSIGDTIITSQYNSVFPPNIIIGRVKKIGSRPDETFHDIDLSLAADFYSLNYVYVVENKTRKEQDILEKQNK